MSGYVADYNESCADCAYHKCSKGCKGGKNCTSGQCLFNGKTGIKCYDKRCKNFKEWKRK